MRALTIGSKGLGLLAPAAAFFLSGCQDLLDSSADRQAYVIPCAAIEESKRNTAGLPLIETNPGAPVVLFVDFDGGSYLNSAGELTYFSPYDLDGSPESFNTDEARDIRLSIARVGQYFAMFDVNVTSDESLKDAAEAWAWILVSEDASGGRASKSSKAVGWQEYPRAFVGSSTARHDNADKSRRIAHELGHNFTLGHVGVWESGEFYKFEDWPDWKDRRWGPIMGAGGKGESIQSH